MNIKEISKKGMLIALYIVLINLNPISFGVIQFRIGEILAVIPFFNRNYVKSFIIAGILGNFYSPLGFIDMIFGGLCALLSYSISRYINNNYLNATIFALICGILIPIELKIILNAPFMLSFISVFMSVLIISCVGVYVFSNIKILNEFIKK